MFFNENEILDLVSADDQVIGKMPRGKIYEQNLSNFRVINAFIINDKNEICIPRRVATKILFPSCLDVSIGGHVASGETYDQAFAREAMEEAQLDITQFDYVKIGTLNPNIAPVQAFMHIYIIFSNQTPEFNIQDFCEYFWMTPEQCLQKLTTEDKGKDDLIPLLKFIMQINISQLRKNEKNLS